MHLHGENRRDELRGFTLLGRAHGIDRVHLPSEVLHTVRLAYTITTPSDHKAVAVQVEPLEDDEGPPRFRFQVEMLQCE